MLQFALRLDARRPPVRGFLTDRGNLLWKTSDFARFAGYKNPHVFAHDRSDKRLLEHCPSAVPAIFADSWVLNNAEALDLLNSLVTTDKNRNHRRSAKIKLWKSFETLMEDPLVTVLEKADRKDETFTILQISDADGSLPFWKWVDEKVEEFLRDEI